MDVLRRVLGVIAGYVAMVVVVFAVVGVAWLVLGASGAFQGEGPYPSVPWLLFSVVGGFLGAVLGGRVAQKVGSGMKAVSLLVSVVVALGVFLALNAEESYAKRERIDKPVAEMSFMEAGQHAKQPAWYNWLIPFVGAAGVWLGGSRGEKE